MPSWVSRSLLEGVLALALVGSPVIASSTPATDRVSLVAIALYGSRYAAALAFSPDGERLATVTSGGKLVLWSFGETGPPRASSGLDPRGRDLLRRSDYLSAHLMEALELRWSPDGRRLWFAGDCGGGTLRCVEPVSGAGATEVATAGVPDFSVRGQTMHRPRPSSMAEVTRIAYAPAPSATPSCPPPSRAPSEPSGSCSSSSRSPSRRPSGSATTPSRTSSPGSRS